ncbi:MAG: hypothetical protein KDI45_09540 [Candidatus Accumulibacter sp.]|nr:hypothetical protein [Accumulibacter sp.]MCB1964708.1 hypothetical protein [Accumulibacter sp.]
MHSEQKDSAVRHPDRQAGHGSRPKSSAQQRQARFDEHASSTRFAINKPVNNNANNRRDKP